VALEVPQTQLPELLDQALFLAQLHQQAEVVEDLGW
jgi:hypothetical protein